MFFSTKKKDWLPLICSLLHCLEASSYVMCHHLVATLLSPLNVRLLTVGSVYPTGGRGGATNQSEIWTSCNIEEITIGLRWHLPSVFWVCNINEEHHSLTDQFWWRETEVLPPGGSTSLLMKLPDNEEVNILMVINLSCLY